MIDFPFQNAQVRDCLPLFSLWEQLMYTAVACQRRERLTCRRATEMNTDEI